jgi:PAS domain S-box-containing protein
VPYFKAGLEHDEHCVWVTSPPLDTNEAWAALARAVPELAEYRKRGRVEVLPHTEWYLRGGRFDQERVLEGWIQKLESARARGCAGLRASGNTSWLQKSDWQSFTDYEAAIATALHHRRMLVLCTYATERCGAAELVDVIRNHEFALIKRDGRWERIESCERRKLIDAQREADRTVERRNAVLGAINRIFREALECRTEEELGQVCLAAAEQVTGSQYGFLGELNARGRLADVAISAPGWSACQLKRAAGPKLEEDLPVRGLYGRVIESGRGLFTNAPATHPDSVGLPEGHAPVGSFLGVPLVSVGKVIGVLAQANRPGGYADEQLEALEELAPAIVHALLRSRADQALRESAHMHEILLRTTRQGYWLVDMESRLLEVNGAYCSMSGYTEEELLRMRVNELEAAESAEEVARHVQRIRSRGHDFFETRHRRKDGTTFYAEIRTTHLDIHGGRLVVFVWDISDRKSAEQALRDADRRKDEFLALLAHELRNPLAPVLNAVEIIRRAPAGDGVRERAQLIIEKQVRHMARLIDDLLDVSRIGQSTIRLQRELCSLGSIVERCPETNTPTQPLTTG